MRYRTRTVVVALALAVDLVAGTALIAHWSEGRSSDTHLVGYFDNSTGIYPGDNVLILGVPVGKIESIKPEPKRARITFSVNRKYRVPAGAHAVIISPQLVTSRAIQLTPAYTGGPALSDHSAIPQNRTAVPVEFDDLRAQLEKLSTSLQPTQPGQPSPLGAFINTAAANLRGRGDDIHAAIIQLSQAIAAFGDHSDDIFTTVKDLSVLASALQSSTTVMQQLNVNFAAVSQSVASDPDAVGQATAGIDAVAKNLQDFVAENKEPIGQATEKLDSISTTLVASLDDVKQALHAAPNVLSNFTNMYSPTLGGSTGVLAINNFANPIQFICGAIQAASRLDSERAAKLCVQYLAPIMKNRQYNFPPIGTTIGIAAPIPVVGATARPNETTYSEDWMRPDYRPATPQPAATVPSPAAPGAPAETSATVPEGSTSPAARPATSTDPSAGLPGMMIPPGAQQ